MKPKPRPQCSQLELFQSQFEQLLSHDHPLYLLTHRIDWQRFAAALSDCYCADLGAPAKSIRLLVGLHYLKHAFNESDESLLERWVENPYWQYFCGFAAGVVSGSSWWQSGGVGESFFCRVIRLSFRPLCGVAGSHLFFERVS